MQRLLDVLGRLVDAGNTVVVIEHNLDVIKTADWIIDLGPEGGDEGGELVAAGTPEQVARVRKSYTGSYLREILAPPRRRAGAASARPQRLPEPPPLRRLAELALVAIAAVWGLTFVMVQDAIEHLEPMTFLAYRFLPAARWWRSPSGARCAGSRAQAGCPGLGWASS